MIVNVEPSKNVVLLHQKQRVLNLVESLLDRIYSTDVNKPDDDQEALLPSNPNLIPPASSSNNAAAPMSESSQIADVTTSTTMPSILSSSSQHANDNTVLTGQTTILGSDDDDLELLNTLSKPHDGLQKVTTDTPALPQVPSPPVGTTSFGANIASSTSARLQEWQFKGGNKQPPKTVEGGGGGGDSTDMEQEHEEPLFRSRKRQRTQESLVDSRFSSMISDDTLPRHSVSARRRPSHEEHSPNMVNSFDILMTSRNRLLRRPGGVEHTVIEGSRQRPLTSYLDTSDKSRPTTESPLERRLVSSEAQSVRPSTPIQNVLQTPVETRRRRQNLTLLEVDHDLVETLNKTMTLDVNVSHIRQRYRLHQARMTKFYRTPLEEYKSLYSQSSGALETCHYVTSLGHNLEIYVSQYHVPSMGTMVGKVAAIDSER
jgi:hypothetical protein